MEDLVLWFKEVSIEDVNLVGGKNASLGELIRELKGLGVMVPDGFAVTAKAYRYYLDFNGLTEKINNLLSSIDIHDLDHLTHRAEQIQALIIGGEFPEDLKKKIVENYRKLSEQAGLAEAYVAVRSSATAEDLPGASFAGQQETYLMVRGEEDLLHSIKKAFASLFTPRAITYRHEHGFPHDKVAISVGVQYMVRSDLASSGVMFTLDTESGFRDVVLINSGYGLGEHLVQGHVTPDEFYVHKPTLKRGYRSLILKKLGDKATRLVYKEKDHTLWVEEVPEDERKKYSLNDDEVLRLAHWGLLIEEHYSRKYGKPTPMDIEWAKDGITGELYIVQARPETVHSQRKQGVIKIYRIKEHPTPILEGIAVGDSIAVGKVRILRSPEEMGAFEDGEILVTSITDPDWVPIMKKASAIITDKGGRTSHAAIVARELGIPAVVGTGRATQILKNGQVVTVSTAEGEVGRIYEGEVAFEVEELDLSKLPKPKTDIMLNVGNPEEAFRAGVLPSAGVGLARMEFIFASWVKIHPLALLNFDNLPEDIKEQVRELTCGYDDKREYFVDKLSQGIATIAAAFWPRPVILRFSDFKSNEYAHLIGGTLYEPNEENPMIGWRGASRYYSPDYKDAFLLEVAAVRRVRERMGLTNLKVMIPFCRTPEEAQRVIKVMEEGGLTRGNGLEIYMMAEVPSNVLLIDEFAKYFDGFSIGSNDLTQFMLGVDRDSERIAHLFDERHPAVKKACAEIIAGAHRNGRKVGICGQAPSDYPDFAAYLVEQGIDSISVIPDALVKTIKIVYETEQRIAQKDLQITK